MTHRSTRGRCPPRPATKRQPSPVAATPAPSRPLPWIESTATLALAHGLGLSPMNRARPCHGYANACGCVECDARAVNPTRRRDEAKQPWQPKAA